MDLLPIKLQLIAIKRQIEAVVAQINGLMLWNDEDDPEQTAAQRPTPPVIATRVGLQLAAIGAQLHELLSGDHQWLSRFETCDLKPGPPPWKPCSNSVAQRISEGVWHELPQEVHG